ncbi:MAG: hypothetical protein C4329_03180 [Chitinophagaceae bacterium]
MKTALTLLIVGAAVAGLVYYLKDNEDVQGFIGKAKDKASDTLDSLKDNYNSIAKKATSTVNDLA